MKGIGRPLSVLIRTEHLIARRRIAVARRQIVLLVLAAVAAGLALVMLNVAGFFALRMVVPPYWAAGLVAAADLCLGALLAVIALTGGTAREAEQAAALRDAALQQIEQELDSAMGELRSVSSGLQRLINDPLGTIAPSALTSLLDHLLHRTKTQQDDTRTKTDPGPGTGPGAG